MSTNRQLQLTAQDALILVDVQNDFLPGGSLAVPDGDQVIPVLNSYIKQFSQQQLPVFATRDWHPENHCSFKPNGGIWPVHCVQNSDGAAFASDLHLPEGTCIISKDDTPTLNSYSGFTDTSLTQQLHAKGCRRLFIGGLATDYCVLNTVLDGIKQGFEVVLLEDAVRAVNLNPDDGDKAIDQMKAAGATGIQKDMLTNATI
ncbi:nicotinamidase [Vibrio sp. CAU 1672]|uniref:nicotinamidase n=1 Tax=Vibrio sp. CAU 1672 TaxID=3032594 RepID=UPI0023DBBAE7|nr:nicotinamidase [Vibrio sp. CAU 1672]MDF2156035.1 nicotinamidase [Vibrio sp. CAU 1672]